MTGYGPRALATSDDFEEMCRELGRQLAALRREAGLTQNSLSARIRFSRTTISVAETGCQELSHHFWQACDKALKARGRLAAGAQQIRAARKATERAAARAAQEAREALALDAFAAAREKSGVTAGISGVQSCPNCGVQVAILTTLIPDAADGTATPPGRDAGILAGVASIVGGP